MNKWRLIVGWGLGILTFLSATNVMYALIHATRGHELYQPFLVGQLIGSIDAIDYFFGSTIMTVGLLSLTTLFVFPPTSLVERLSNTKLACFLPNYPNIEALQVVQMNVLDQIQASDQANAERIEFLTTQFQMYQKEMMAFMERQEDNVHVLLTTMPQKHDNSFNELEQLITERRETIVVNKKPTVIRKKVPPRTVNRRRKKRSAFTVSWRKGL